MVYTILIGNISVPGAQILFCVSSLGTSICQTPERRWLQNRFFRTQRLVRLYYLYHVSLFDCRRAVTGAEMIKSHKFLLFNHYILTQKTLDHNNSGRFSYLGHKLQSNWGVNEDIEFTKSFYFNFFSWKSLCSNQFPVPSQDQSSITFFRPVFKVWLMVSYRRTFKYWVLKECVKKRHYRYASCSGTVRLSD